MARDPRHRSRGREVGRGTARAQTSAAQRPSLVRGTPPSHEIPGDLKGALEDVNLPSYAIDRFGIIRWLNPAARRMVGDVRGKQFTSVAPEATLEAREAFTRKVIGTEQHTDGDVVLIDERGRRVQAEISSAPLREGGHIVGVFGIITHRQAAKERTSDPHLTPRQHQILDLLAHGQSTRQIAARLHVTVHTVRNHIRHLLRALGAHSRLEAIAIARHNGLLEG